MKRYITLVSFFSFIIFFGQAKKKVKVAANSDLAISQNVFQQFDSFEMFIDKKEIDKVIVKTDSSKIENTVKQPIVSDEKVIYSNKNK